MERGWPPHRRPASLPRYASPVARNTLNIKRRTDALQPRSEDAGVLCVTPNSMSAQEGETMDIDQKKAEAFLESATNFFSWNSGKNTPNVLAQLSENTACMGKSLSEKIDKLDASLNNASSSADKLAATLNRLTLVAVIIAALSLLVASFGMAKSKGICQPATAPYSEPAARSQG